jgi:hypothetical protein
MKKDTIFMINVKENLFLNGVFPFHEIQVNTDVGLTSAIGPQQVYPTGQ